MSILSGFSLDEISLALSLVIDWQVEKVKEQPLWPQWSDLKTICLPGDPDPQKPDFNGLDFDEDQTAIECKDHKVVLRGQLDVRDDSYYIIGRALFMPCADDRWLYGLNERSRVGCQGSNLYCVSPIRS